MYVIIKENATYYSSTINMDSVVDVTIDRGGSGNTEYRLLFILIVAQVAKVIMLLSLKTRHRLLNNSQKYKMQLK